MGCAGSKGTQVVSSNPTNGKAAPKSVKAPVTTTTVKEDKPKDKSAADEPAKSEEQKPTEEACEQANVVASDEVQEFIKDEDSVPEIVDNGEEHEDGIGVNQMQKETERVQEHTDDEDEEDDSIPNNDHVPAEEEGKVSSLEIKSNSNISNDIEEVEIISDHQSDQLNDEKNLKEDNSSDNLSLIDEPQKVTETPKEEEKPQEEDAKPEDAKVEEAPKETTDAQETQAEDKPEETATTTEQTPATETTEAAAQDGGGEQQTNSADADGDGDD